MSVRLACECGYSKTLTEFFAGKQVECPKCGAQHLLPQGDKVYRVESDADFSGVAGPAPVDQVKASYSQERAQPSYGEQSHQQDQREGERERPSAYIPSNAEDDPRVQRHLQQQVIMPRERSATKPNRSYQLASLYAKGAQFPEAFQQQRSKGGMLWLLIAPAMIFFAAVMPAEASVFMLVYGVALAALVALARFKGLRRTVGVGALGALAALGTWFAVDSISEGYERGTACIEAPLCSYATSPEPAPIVDPQLFAHPQFVELHRGWSTPSDLEDELRLMQAFEYWAVVSAEDGKLPNQSAFDFNASLWSRWRAAAGDVSGVHYSPSHDRQSAQFTMSDSEHDYTYEFFMNDRGDASVNRTFGVRTESDDPYSNSFRLTTYRENTQVRDPLGDLESGQGTWNRHTLRPAQEYTLPRQLDEEKCAPDSEQRSEQRDEDGADNY